MVRSFSRADSAQLLLISAIVLAVLVLGLAVLLNAALFAGGHAPGGASVDIADADRLHDDINRDMGTLLAWLNERGPYAAESDLSADVTANASTFADRLFETVGDHRGALLDLEVASLGYGTYVADANRSTPLTLEDENEPTVSERISASEPRAIVNLEFSIDTGTVTENASNATAIQVIGDNDVCRAIGFVATDDNEVSILRSDFDCATEEPTFDPAEEVIATTDRGPYVNISLGERPHAHTDVYYDIFADIEPIASNGDDRYGLAIRNPHGIDGAYHYLIDGAIYDPPPAGYSSYPATESDGPYVAPIVWSLDVNLSHVSRTTDRTTQLTVQVYEDVNRVPFPEVPWE